MWQFAFFPSTHGVLADTIINDIRGRRATLHTLYRLSSSEAIGAECIGDVAEIRHLSENICREFFLEHGDREMLWDIDFYLKWTIQKMYDEFIEKKKSINDGSRGTEDVWNELWREYRREFRSLIRRFIVYFGYVHERWTFQ